MVVRVPDVSVMVDETLMLHLEKRHGNDVSMRFQPRPDQEVRELSEPHIWRTFHDAVHRIHPASDYDHEHNPVEEA